MSDRWETSDRDYFINRMRRRGANTSHFNGRNVSVYMDSIHLTFQDDDRRAYVTRLGSRGTTISCEWTTGDIEDWMAAFRRD